MAISNSDIRLVEGDTLSVVNTIREYVSYSGFTIDREKISDDKAYIRASNPQRSFVKLYLSNSPQIVEWYIVPKNNREVEIEIKSNLFFRFRLIYYTILSSFLICFNLFFTSNSSFKYKSFNFLQQFSIKPSSFNIILAIIFLVLAFFYFLRSLNTSHYEDFLNHFYNEQAQNGISKSVVLQTGFGFPDFLKGPLFFAVSFLITFLLSRSNIPVHYLQLPYFHFLFVATILTFSLIILVFLMVYRSYLATRVAFILVGVGICIPISIYSNAPVALSYPGSIQEKLEHVAGIDGISYNKKNNYALQEIKINYSHNLVRKVFLFFMSTCILLFLIAGSLYIFILRIPIRIVRELKHFSWTIPESAYYKALHSQRLSFLFNSVIVLLWLIISVTNISGLYLSLSIFEKAVFNKNILFISELAQLFYENTQLTFIFLGQSKFVNFSLLAHRMIMLIYSFPMITALVIVLGKNIRTIIKEYLLVKKQSNRYVKIEEEISDKLESMCKSVNVALPIVRVFDSSDINADTKYLGFPFFKNIVVIKKDIYDDLHFFEDELEALLAHEIWHIKRHTLIRKLLCSLSDYSLFGNGFLALLQNSYQVEGDADDFAVNWLIKKSNDREKAVYFLKSLIERLDEIDWKTTVTRLTGSYHFFKINEPSYRDKMISEYDNASGLDRVLKNLRILYEMYFGTAILSYFHPSSKQRISWVEEKYCTDEADSSKRSC